MCRNGPGSPGSLPLFSPVNWTEPKSSELHLRDPPRGGDSAYLHEDPYTQGWQGHEEWEYARRAFRPKHQRALWYRRAARQETWPLLAHPRVIDFPLWPIRMVLTFGRH